MNMEQDQQWATMMTTNDKHDDYCHIKKSVWMRKRIRFLLLHVIFLCDHIIFFVEEIIQRLENLLRRMLKRNIYENMYKRKVMSPIHKFLPNENPLIITTTSTAKVSFFTWKLERATGPAEMEGEYTCYNIASYSRAWCVSVVWRME